MKNVELHHVVTINDKGALKNIHVIISKQNQVHKAYYRRKTFNKLKEIFNKLLQIEQNTETSISELIMICPDKSTNFKLVVLEYSMRIDEVQDIQEKITRILIDFIYWHILSL